MATTPFDPDLPRDNSLISAGELRCQLVALDNAITEANNNSAANADAVAALGLTVSNPPTQAEVQAAADKLDELLAALRRA